MRGVNGSGTSSGSNIISALTKAPAPVANSATGATQTSFTAHWNTSTSATSYVIDVSPDGFTTFVPTYQDASVGNVTSVAVNGLSGGVTYSYRIRAVNTSGESPNSNTIVQVTIPNAPTITTATAITTTSFVANWATTTGADSYRIDVSTDNFSTFLAGFNNITVVSTSSSVTGLTEGVTYSYRVRAVNASGTSGNSTVASVITVPPAPTTTNATAITTTSFTANWTAVDGATQYFLDISADDFNSFLPGYNNKSTTAISEALTGLTPNTTYKYRLRATSSSGTSDNSNITTVTSYSTPPLATAATGVTQTSFNANWNAVAGISSYELDVSTDNFVTMISTYNALVVTQTTQVVTGLTPGAAYTYRVRAVNATGPSVNSNVISTSVIPATPTANSATSVAQKGFTASWTTADNTTDYLLDLSTASNFGTFQPGYNAKAITSTSEAITGLLSGTTYYYRVRSRNASGESPSSNQVSQITIPDNPSATVVTAKSNTSFIAVWDAVTGAESYELDVTTFASNFTSFVTNYENHPIAGGNNTEEEVIGLTPGTAYRYRVRAVNAGGTSGNSNARSVQTEGGNVGEFTVTASPSNTQFSGAALDVTGQVTNFTGEVTGELTYHGLAESTVHTKPIDADNTGRYSVSIEDNMLDDLGIQFTVTAEDELGKTKTTDTQKIYRSFTTPTSPVLLSGSFTRDRLSIRIISIPYDLKDNLIESIFVSLGTYDKKSCAPCTLPGWCEY
ncbi:MAG: fibronectin type III domain-containing protein [Bacteroidota bacterium]